MLKFINIIVILIFKKASAMQGIFRKFRAVQYMIEDWCCPLVIALSRVLVNLKAIHNRILNWCFPNQRYITNFNWGIARDEEFITFRGICGLAYGLVLIIMALFALYSISSFLGIILKGLIDLIRVIF